MLDPLFSAVEVARERLNRMLNAAMICVCPVVYTHVADCLLVAIGPCRPRMAPEEKERLQRLENGERETKTVSYGTVLLSRKCYHSRIHHV
jgi:hypothetical protein